jgi:hypothetical protein
MVEKQLCELRVAVDACVVQRRPVLAAAARVNRCTCAQEGGCGASRVKLDRQHQRRAAFVLRSIGVSAALEEQVDDFVAVEDGGQPERRAAAFRTWRIQMA